MTAETTVAPGDPEPAHNTVWTSQNIEDCEGSLLYWDSTRDGWTWGTEAFAYPWTNHFVQHMLPARKVTQ